MDTKTKIDEMENIRKINNSLWMELLRIALESNPEKTKNVIKQIRTNDMKISEIFDELSQ